MLWSLETLKTREIMLLLLTALAVGAADDQPTLAVVGIHQDGLDATSQSVWLPELAAAVAADGRFATITGDDLSRALVGRESIVLQEAFMGPGQRLLDDGQALADQAQPEEAVVTLEEARDALLLGVGPTNSVEELWQAEATLGSEYRVLGSNDDADAAFARAVALMPSRLLDPARYPPDLVAAYAVVRDVRTAEVGSLEVTADAEVEVYLDGEARGAAPLTLTDVVAGTHHVVVRAEDGSMDYGTVDVATGEAATFSATVQPPSLGESSSSRYGRARQTSALYKSLARQAEVDLVLLAGVSEGMLHIQLFSRPSDAFSTPIEVPYVGTAEDELIAHATEVLRFANDDGSLPSALSAAAPVPLSVDANAWLASVLLAPPDLSTVELVEVRSIPWTPIILTGVGVAAAGTTAGLLLSGGEDEGRLRGTIVVGPVP